MQKIDQVVGTGVPLLLDDIDTDRIIPARYLRCVTFDGLGEHAFEDDRIQDEAHPFNDARYQDGAVLIVGRNFGCGSSREHAPQALLRWGIRAIVGESFAEIFFGNCTSLGIPCARVSRMSLEHLVAAVRDDPETEITIDLIESQIHTDKLLQAAEFPESARKALTTGTYDFLAQLLEGEEQIRETASGLPYVNGFIV